MLRQLAVTARHQARWSDGAPTDPKLWAGRGLVLGLPKRAVLRGSSARPAGTSSGRTTDARSRRASSVGLAASPTLTP